MGSLKLASNDGQVNKDKSRHCILKVTITFVNNSTLTLTFVKVEWLGHQRAIFD